MINTMSKKRGMSVVEILVGSAVITIGILALIQAFGIYLRYALSNDKSIQAAYVAEEGLEVMGFLRDGTWSAQIHTLSTTTTYHLLWNGGGSAWTTTTTPQYVDGVFLRQILVTDVFRDGGGEMVASGGTYDPDTKMVRVLVKYPENHSTTTVTMTTYLTNMYGN